MRATPSDLSVDWSACKGHGLCAELLPDHITRDDWGYPIIEGPVSPAAAKRARQAVTACPALALRLKALQPVEAQRPRSPTGWWAAIGQRRCQGSGSGETWATAAVIASEIAASCRTCSGLSASNTAWRTASTWPGAASASTA